MHICYHGMTLPFLLIVAVVLPSQYLLARYT
jgi:hypothetical protein